MLDSHDRQSNQNIYIYIDRCGPRKDVWSLDYFHLYVMVIVFVVDIINIVAQILGVTAKRKDQDDLFCPDLVYNFL